MTRQFVYVEPTDLADLVVAARTHKGERPIFVGPYGFMLKQVHEWLNEFDPVDIALARASGYNIELTDDLSIVVKLYRGTMNDIRGGYFEIWYKDDYIRLNDAYGFFGGRPFNKLVQAYGTRDLAEIMERTRESLEGVGLSSHYQRWYRASSIVDSVWDVKDDLSEFKSEIRPKGGHIGCSWFGHSKGDYYYYDINGAYLYQLWRFEHNREYPFREVAERLWDARVQLGKDPAAAVVKLAATTIVGRFAGFQGLTKLAQLIYDDTTYQLKSAMRAARDCGGKIIRYYIDGFITDVDCLETSNQLGGWKLDYSSTITSVDAGTYWIEGKSAHRGLSEGAVTESAFIDHFKNTPYEPVTFTEPIYNPYKLCYRTHRVTFDFKDHKPRQCTTCLTGSAGPDTELHQLVKAIPA